MQTVQLGNTDFEGLNNVYVLEGAAGPTLIDTGVNTPAGTMYDQLTKGLDDLGTSVTAVERILLTHWHPDHVGLASRVAAASGASVHIHERDAPLVRAPAWRQLEPIYRRRMDEWGMPEAKREALRARFDHEDDVLSGDDVDVVEFRDGDTFESGTHTLQVVHTPGHTAGHSCFETRHGDDRVLFSGDALLPVYTPNVGGADVRCERPLQQYLDTLSRLVDRGYDTAYPGHRGPIKSPITRAREIVAHHRERSQKILDVLNSTPRSVWSVSERQFGELDDIHILHGPGEAYAHLDHLAVTGIVKQTDHGFCRLDTSPVDLQSLFPNLGTTADI